MERVERLARYRLDGETWEGRLARFRGLGWRAAIAGPHGSGKTTLLEDIAPRLAALGFRPRLLRLDAERQECSHAELRQMSADRGAFILLDGAEQMGWMAWRRFSRATLGAQGLLITVHRASRLPTLLTTRTSPELVEVLLADLGCERWRSEARELFARHGGNVREVLRGLYDFAAEERSALPGPRAGENVGGS